MRFEIDIEDDFLEIFTSGGATELTCKCGQRHIAIEQYYSWDEDHEGQIDEIVASLKEEEENDIDLTLHYDCDSMAMIEFHDGPSFVAGCKCEGWRPYMNWIIHQRRDIARFLIATSREIKRVQRYEDVMDVLEKEYEQ